MTHATEEAMAKAKAGKRSKQSYTAWEREREARARVAFALGGHPRQGERADDPYKWHRDLVRAEMALGGLYDEPPAKSRKAPQDERVTQAIAKLWPDGLPDDLSITTIHIDVVEILKPESRAKGLADPSYRTVRRVVLEHRSRK
jgi:hypothetical protein